MYRIFKCRIRLVVVLAVWFTCGAEVVQAQPRVLGLDVSAWQGNISQNTWNNIKNVEDRDFVFLRSSRGGTTGFYNQSDPNNNNNQNTLSQRYDDPYFVQNITRATSAGIFAGAYHFSRPDIIATTQNSGGIANTGADEADHFIEMAGAWMRPGYLMPVHDLEAGDGIRTDNEMAQFAIDFSNRVHEVMGIRPAIYLSGNYAEFVLGGASSSLQDQVVSLHPKLWSARWPNQNDPNSIPVQTGHPGDSISWVYGPWDDGRNADDPWTFWQYASTGRLQSYNNGNSNLDFNVAQGGMEFLKDQLVPALWMNDSDGQWSTLTNWNSGQTPIAPVQGPGQVPRVGPLTLPTERLPGPDDTVILDRTGANISVTLASGDHEIRKLELREALDITGGSLTVNYVPSPDSTTLGAHISAPLNVDGGSLSVHTMLIDAGQTLSLAGGLTLDTIELAPSFATPAQINITGDVNFAPLASAEAEIVSAAGGGTAGHVDLGGENRTWNIANGGASDDLAIDVPVINGALTKEGFGALVLRNTTSYTGDTTVTEGRLTLENPVLDDAADVHLSTGSVLELDFSGSPDVVNALFIDGVPQAAGTWGPFGSGAQFTSFQLAGMGMLEVVPLVAGLSGDFNNDGTVNAADYVVWRDNLGAADESTLNGNGDGLGGVDAGDYALWVSNFGATSGTALGVATVPIPEPAVLLLLQVALLSGALQRSPRQ